MSKYRLNPEVKSLLTQTRPELIIRALRNRDDIPESVRKTLKRRTKGLKAEGYNQEEPSP
jgi:hypothetical protein